VKRHSQKILDGTAHISAVDPVMRPLVAECPPLTSLRLQSNRFRALINSILSQQISIHTARAIRLRLTELAGPEGLTESRVKQLSPDQLQSVGISRPKAKYLNDLADHVQSGRLRLNQIGRSSDSGVIEQLTAVKGIGVWTAQMFLIFSLGRLNVFPHDDYGIRAAIGNLYGLGKLPDKKTSSRIAEQWGPYRTIGTWYCWRSHELRGKKGGGI
jgi:DNA-3-methyladenine glycosylase II